MYSNILFQDHEKVFAPLNTFKSNYLNSILIDQHTVVDG